jgi:hypothetical protein
MRLLATLAAAVLLAGCGGGGSSGAFAPSGASSTSTTPSTALAVPAPKNGPTATPANANRAAVATAAMTLKFPAGFHTAKMQSQARLPAYVNPGPVPSPSSTPTASYYLDVWVVNNGTPTHVVDSSGGINVNAANGIQSFSIPLFSTSNNQVVAYETDAPFGTYSHLLAVGESDVGAITAGSSPQITLTMQMNAAAIGVMSNPDNANGDATTLSPYLSFGLVCAPISFGPLYFFVTDPTGGFVDVGGIGGTVQPTVVSVTSDVQSPADALSQNAGIAGGYNVVLNNTNMALGVTVKLQAINPAYPLGYAAVAFGGGSGPYPGLSTLYTGYYDSALYNYLSAIYSEAFVSPAGSITNTIQLLGRSGC